FHSHSESICTGKHANSVQLSWTMRQRYLRVLSCATTEHCDAHDHGSRFPLLYPEWTEYLTWAGDRPHTSRSHAGVQSVPRPEALAMLGVSSCGRTGNAQPIPARMEV